MSKRLGLVMMVLSLVACIKIRDPEAEPAMEKIAPKSVPKISYEIQALPQPQRYLVRFVGVPQAFSSLQRFQPDKGLKALVLEGAEDIVEEAGLYEYRFQLQDREEKVLVTIPRDLVIEGEMSLAKLPVAEVTDSLDFNRKLVLDGRLYFKAKSILTTDGAKLLIEANAIESEGASIQTFSPGSMNLYGDGLDGGKVHLKSQSFSGTLQVTMRGQKGGNGSLISPPKGRSKRDGFDGGNTGLLIVEVEDLSKGHILYSLEPGAEGTGLKIGSGKASGRPGHPGVEQMPCLLKNGICEELKAYNH